MVRIWRLVLSFVLALVFSGAAQAQDAAEIIKKSLVYLTAEGTRTDTGEQVKTEGNGFITSKDGYVVTNYHLIAKLGDNVGDVKFQVSIGSRSAPPRSASIVSSNAINDLIRLKITDTAGLDGQLIPVKFVSPSELREKFVDTNSIFDVTIHTLSFVSAVNDFSRDSGKVTSRAGPAGFLWVTKMRFAEGQSGSPVFFDDGRVIGIVKGSSADGDFGYFVPVEFATGVDPVVFSTEMAYMLANSRSANNASAADQLELVRKSIEALQKGFQAKVEEIPSLYNRLESEGYLNNKLGLSRQALAQATCGAQAPRAKTIAMAFAVPRRCEGDNAQTCAAVCDAALHKSRFSTGQPAANLKCVDSYSLPGTNLATENESLSLSTGKYGRCDVPGCGPNFCCCAILVGGAK